MFGEGPKTTQGPSHSQQPEEAVAFQHSLCFYTFWYILSQPQRHLTPQAVYEYPPSSSPIQEPSQALPAALLV